MRNAFLIGEQVYLRPLEESDAATCHAWFSDPEVRRTLGRHAVPSTEASVREFVRTVDFVRNQVFAVVMRDGDAHVGNAGLHDINPVDRNASLGIVIGRKDHWRRGLGTEAVRLLCRHAFDTLDLHRVGLSCYATNERAIGIYTRIGFRLEGRRREQAFVEGRRVDELVLGLLRGELVA